MAVEHMKELGFENMVSDGGNGITIHNKLVEIKPLDYDKCINLINDVRKKDIFGQFHLIMRQDDWHQIIAFMFTHVSIWYHSSRRFGSKRL